ncbi:MAG TPA: NAD(P)H-dependent oxidoreductase [Roseimicrobium sp.]|nr:NAD(P)H-dependent oxidoreductase [Roseimicrobium sp.]
MSDHSIHVVAVVGSLHKSSSTHAAVRHVAGELAKLGVTVDIVDFDQTPLPLFNPDTSWKSAEFAALKERVDKADVFLLATPDYHGSVSSTLKNFLDHFWKEYAGRLFASIVISHDKGLTVTDQIRTVARQCYAWSLPYAVVAVDRDDIKDGQVASDAFRQRLEMMAHDIRTYGGVIAKQRTTDLSGTAPGFLARLRKL